MDRKTYIIIIVIVAVLAVAVTIFLLKRLQEDKYTVAVKEEQLDELIALKVAFPANVLNSGLLLPEETEVKDTTGAVIPLRQFFRDKQEYLFVCRFSERNCESCVQYAIKNLLQWRNAFGDGNIIFLGGHRNNRLFVRQLPLYGIDVLQAANTTSLNIPADQLGFPYYFVLDKEMRIVNLFVPDKNSPQITQWYLKLVGERFF